VSASSKIPEFDTFHLLIDRNIFSASRGTPAEDELDAEGAKAFSESARLMGTWLEGDRAVALFEGMPGNTHQTLGRNGVIAGYQIDDIRTDGVTLYNDENTMELQVGSGLAKIDDSWTVVENMPVPEQAAPATAAAVKKDTATTPAETKRERRMLKRNRKE
jgi:hypothetical protein